MQQAEDVSHGDIYHKLGSLEGKMEALLISSNERRADISNVFSRLRQIEHRVAWGMGAAVVLSLIAPHLLQLVEHKIQSDASIERHR